MEGHDLKKKKVKVKLRTQQIVDEIEQSDSIIRWVKYQTKTQKEKQKRTQEIHGAWWKV